MRTRSTEALVTQTIVTPLPAVTTPFQNLGPIRISSENQLTGFLNIPPISPIRLPFIVNIIGEETPKESPADRAYDKWIELEERMKMIEGSNLYDLVKETEICLVSNVMVPKDF